MDPAHPSPGASAFAVLGGGAWGTAMAVALSAHGAVRLWCRDPAQASSLLSNRENSRLLPGVQLPASVHVSADLAWSVSGASRVALAVPVNAVRETCSRIRESGALGPRVPLLLLCKGFELASGELPHRVVETELPGYPVFVLSGPSFAAEVGRGLPTAVSLAGTTLESARAEVESVHTPRLRVYASDDRIGVEVGGAVKNVLAIACGVSEGRGLGRSAHAALITRGFAELTRMAVALGGRAETVAGLCGLGDLVLTCSSPQSRNMSVGLALGQGKSLEEALAGKVSVAEGVASAPAMRELAARIGVEAPICEAVAAILAGEVGVEAAITGLLSRPLKSER